MNVTPLLSHRYALLPHPTSSYAAQPFASQGSKAHTISSGIPRTAEGNGEAEQNVQSCDNAVASARCAHSRLHASLLKTLYNRGVAAVQSGNSPQGYRQHPLPGSSSLWDRFRGTGRCRPSLFPETTPRGHAP